MSLLPVAVFLALAPPRHAETHFARLQHEAFRLHHVEEEFAHQVRCGCIRHLETRSEPLVARAVHDGVDAPVEEAVLVLEGGDVEGARRVVHAAALVRAAEASQLRVLDGGATLATPLGARHAQQVHQLSLPPLDVVGGTAFLFLAATPLASHQVAQLSVHALALLAQRRVVQERRHVARQILLVLPQRLEGEVGEFVGADGFGVAGVGDVGVSRALDVCTKRVQEVAHDASLAHKLTVAQMLVCAVDELDEVRTVSQLQQRHPLPLPVGAGADN